MELSPELMNRAILRPDVVLFAQSDAVIALGELQRGGAVLLGADSFRVVPDGLLVLADVNVSGQHRPEHPFDVVRSFLNRQPDDSLIELVWD